MSFGYDHNDTVDVYAYTSRVRFELAEEDIVSYQRAAGFLSINNVDLVSLQHRDSMSNTYFGSSFYFYFDTFEFCP